MPGSLSTYKYHGHGRAIPLLDLLSHDIILTTYGTVAADIKAKNDLLHRVVWYRVVLDEGRHTFEVSSLLLNEVTAHVIRNAATKQHRAISTIQARVRWCLTGTPIQNSIDDFASLVQFLRVPVMKDATQFRRHITNKIKQGSGDGHSGFENLRMLIASIALRRNRDLLFIDQDHDVTHVLDLSAYERQKYDGLGQEWRYRLELAVSGRSSQKSHQLFVELLLRMRMFCNNGDMLHLRNEDLEADELGSLHQSLDKVTCAICSMEVATFGGINDSSSGSFTACHALLCGDCSEEYDSNITTGRKCPVCGGIHQHLLASQGLNKFRSKTSSFPTKIERLYEDLREHLNDSKR